MSGDVDGPAVGTDYDGRSESRTTEGGALVTALQLDDIRAYWRSYEIGAAIGTPLEIIARWHVHYFAAQMRKVQR